MDAEGKLGKEKEKHFKFLSFLKNNKLIKITKNKKAYVAIVCLLSLIVFAIFFSSVGSKKANNNTVEQPSSSTVDFVSETEARLKTILSSVKGISDVNVYISVSSTPIFCYATDTTSQNGSNQETSNIVFSKSGTSTTPVLVKTIYPEIKGVLIVAKGAGEAKVKLMLCDCLSSVLNVPASCIQILEGK